MRLFSKTYLRPSPRSAAALGERYGVSTSIHIDDFVFSHLQKLHNRDPDKALAAYLESGRVSAERIRDLVADLQGAAIADGKIDVPMTLLDFASGYGCVARHIGRVFPRAKLCAMDIHDKAMYFNGNDLGIQAALSRADPSEVDAFFQFDVVFVLSFFSHLPRARINPWLRKLVEFVKVDGILIFTAHGATTHRDHVPYFKVDDEGFAFERTSEQKDLPLDDYGNAITYSKLVFAELSSIENIELLSFRAGSWWGHQDHYVVRKLRA